MLCRRGFFPDVIQCLFLDKLLALELPCGVIQLYCSRTCQRFCPAVRKVRGKQSCVFTESLLFTKQTPGGEEWHFPRKLLWASRFRIKVSAFASPRLHIPMVVPPRQVPAVLLDVCFSLCCEILERTLLCVFSGQDKVNCWVKGIENIC